MEHDKLSNKTTREKFRLTISDAWMFQNFEPASYAVDGVKVNRWGYSRHA